MKKLIKKIIIWAFRDKILVLGKSEMVHDVQWSSARYPAYYYVQKDIAYRIALEMVETGIIKFKEVQEIKQKSRTITGEVYVLDI